MFDTEIIRQWITTEGLSLAARIVQAILILGIGRWAARRASDGASHLMHRAKMDSTLISFSKGIIQYGILLFVIISALNKLGLPTASFAALLAAAGLAIGFAMEGSLSNFAAGVMILAFRPYSVGDFVEVNDETGYVEEVTIFNTVLKTLDNKQVIISNSAATSNNITNYSAHGTLRVDLVAGIGYDDDIRKAKAIFMEILQTHPLVLEDPAPTVDVLELGASSVNFAIRPHCKVGDYWRVYFDVTEQIKLRCDEEGISIPYPQRDVHLIQPPA